MGSCIVKMVITMLEYHGKNIFVDCLSHFNHKPLLMRTLQQMGSIYLRKCKIVAYFRKECNFQSVETLHQCITEAHRGWMGQEVFYGQRNFFDWCTVELLQSAIQRVDPSKSVLQGIEELVAIIMLYSRMYNPQTACSVWEQLIDKRQCPIWQMESWKKAVQESDMFYRHGVQVSSSSDDPPYAYLLRVAQHTRDLVPYFTAEVLAKALEIMREPESNAINM